MQDPRERYQKLLIASVYFVQGIVGITGLATFILTRNLFHFSWMQLALLGALSTLTWSVKPLYGFLTDLVPIHGQRRKPYLMISSLLTTLGYFLLSAYGTGFISIALFIVILNIGLGFSDVIIDGLVVQISTPETVGKYQSLCWRAKAFAILFAALFSGYFIERGILSSWLGHTSLTAFLSALFPHTFINTFIGNVNILDIRYIFLFTALFPFIVLIIAIFMKEPPDTNLSEEEALSSSVITTALIALGGTLTLMVLATLLHRSFPQFSSDTFISLGTMIIWGIWIGFYLRGILRRGQATPTLIFAALFLFLWRFTPSFGAPWSDYYINVLKLSQEKLGYLSTLSALSWIFGTLIYNRFFDSVPLKKLLFWTVLIGVLMSFTQLIVATPDLANHIGNISIIKYPAAIMLYPAYFFGYQGQAWQELMTQPGILNLDAILSFVLELMFMISYLPLLKLAALVTPKGVEATNFSVMASIMNLGLVFGTISGGLIYTWIEGSYNLGSMTFTGLHLTIIIGALTSLICLPVLRYLKDF